MAQLELRRHVIDDQGRESFEAFQMGRPYDTGDEPIQFGIPVKGDLFKHVIVEPNPWSQKARNVFVEDTSSSGNIFGGVVEKGIAYSFKGVATPRTPIVVDSVFSVHVVLDPAEIAETWSAPVKLESAA